MHPQYQHLDQHALSERAARHHHHTQHLQEERRLRRGRLRLALARRIAPSGARIELALR